MAPEMGSSASGCCVVGGDSCFVAGDRAPTATTIAASSGEQQLRAELAARREKIGILRHPVVTLR